jgi:hypothetical protein
MSIPKRMTRHAALAGVLAGGFLFTAAPALAAAPETPTTEAASVIAGTSATLNGTLNPNASATTGYFFAYAPGASCEGGPTTTPGAEAPGQKIKVSTPVTGLEGSTEYTFCVEATNPEGTTPGLPLSFKTLAAKPTAEGGEVVGITPISAAAYTFVNPENQPTTECVFEYGVAPAFDKTAPCEPGSVEGSEAQFVAANFTALTPGTAYDYRIAVTNATGKTTGATGMFSTSPLEAPIYEGEFVSGVTPGAARLEALINPNYQKTTYAFEYATNKALTGAISVAGENPLPEEVGTQLASVPLAGLQPRTVYYYRVVAKNGTGTTDGPVEEFTTLATPLVTTGEAREITRTTAEVSGTANPGGVPTHVQVAYVNQEGFEAVGGSKAANPYADGRLTPTTSIAGADFTAHSIGAVQLRELTPGTTYHFAVIASNSIGVTIGPDQTFTTSAPTPPVVVTGEPVGIAQMSATLTGSVDTRGLQTVLSFEYGTTTALGSSKSASVVPGSESGTTVGTSASFGSYLQPGTTYYYRATASNADGVSYGAVKAFTTASYPAPPTLTSPPLLPVHISPAPGKTGGGGTPPKAPTKAQKLAKALKACQKKPKAKRATCQRQAHKKYPTKKKKKK